MTTKEQLIIENAVRLFSKHGIKEISMDHIARVCGMSKRTIYEVMRSKNELVGKTIFYIADRDQQITEQSRMKEHDAIDEMLYYSNHIKQWVQEFSPQLEYDLMKHYPQIFRKMNELRKQRIYQIILDNLQKGKREQVYREDLKPDWIARLMIFRLDSLMDNELLTMEEAGSAAFYQEVFRYHMHGILNEKGLKMYEERFRNKANAHAIMNQFSFIPAS